MKRFYTCPDVLGTTQDREQGLFIPTIYSVEADISVSSQTIRVANNVAEVLDRAPVVNRFYLIRPTKFTPLSDADLITKLRSMPDIVTHFTEDNTSSRQWDWSGKWETDPRWEVSNIWELRCLVKPEGQYAPYGDYYADLEPLLTRLEDVWWAIINKNVPQPPLKDVKSLRIPRRIYKTGSS